MAARTVLVAASSRLRVVAMGRLGQGDSARSTGQPPSMRVWPVIPVPPRRSVGCSGGLPVVDGAGARVGGADVAGGAPVVVDVAGEMIRVAAGWPVVWAGVVP